MKKYLPYLFFIPITLSGCSKHHSDPQPQPSNGAIVNEKYVLYLKIDTTYDYSAPTLFNLDVTHETLTGDTLYLKAGTANQVIQPNPITGYDPKVALSDTVYVTRRIGSTGATFNWPSDPYIPPPPGVSLNFYLLNNNTVEFLYKYMDPDNPPGYWTEADGWYFKKL
jgi:hypothetical protein